LSIQKGDKFLKVFIVKKENNEFFNSSHFIAYEGFNMRKFDIVFFHKIEEIMDQITAETPVVAGVGFIHKILKKRNIEIE